MTDRQEKHYKEVAPEQTVQHLQQILKENHIETEEYWLPVSTLGTYSLRVTIKGTSFGTNGKGVTKEFARASAYAEFFERFQNSFLDLNCMFSRKTKGFRHFADEHIISAMELAEQDNTFMRNFYRTVGLENAGFFEKASYLAAYFSSETYYCQGESGFEMRPYFNAMAGKVEEISFLLANQLYASNGMCAGNSPEEALIQGLSEIFERYVQRQMMLHNLSFPNVPEEVIQRWSYVYEMFCKAKSMEGYYVALKDCSMGGRFPAAALVICQKNTGKWGIKFGAYPDFGIAMERTMTEATQGIDLAEYCFNNQIDFRNFHTDNEINIFNTYKCGIGFYPYQFLSEISDFEPWNPPDISQKSNREILDSMVETVRKEGFSMYVRDVSYSGFPSFHIIIPEMSEVFHTNTYYARTVNTHMTLLPVINAPERLTEKDVKKFCCVLENLSDFQYFYNLPYLFQYARNTSDFPAYTDKGGGFDCCYFKAMAYIYLKDYQNACRSMYEFITGLKRIDSEKLMSIGYTQKNLNEWNAILYYLSAMEQINNHEKTMSYMEIMFDEEIVKKIDYLFSDPEQVFVKQYPSRQVPSLENPDGTDCEQFNLLMDCYDKLKELQLRNPISQERLSELFSD